MGAQARHLWALKHLCVLGTFGSLKFRLKAAERAGFAPGVAAGEPQSSAGVRCHR